MGLSPWDRADQGTPMQGQEVRPSQWDQCTKPWSCHSCIRNSNPAMNHSSIEMHFGYQMVIKWLCEYTAD